MNALQVITLIAIALYLYLSIEARKHKKSSRKYILKKSVIEKWMAMSKIEREEEDYKQVIKSAKRKKILLEGIQKEYKKLQSSKNK